MAHYNVTYIPSAACRNCVSKFDMKDTKASLPDISEKVWKDGEWCTGLFQHFLLIKQQKLFKPMERGSNINSRTFSTKSENSEKH